MPRYLLDLAERTGATFVEAFLGLLLVSGHGTFTVSAVEAAAGAGAIAALTVVKGAVAAFLGDHQTAALLPAETPARTAPRP